VVGLGPLACAPTVEHAVGDRALDAGAHVIGSGALAGADVIGSGALAGADVIGSGGSGSGGSGFEGSGAELATFEARPPHAPSLADGDDLVTRLTALPPIVIASPTIDLASNDPEVLAGLWETLQDALRRRMHAEQFETWFRRAILRSIDPESVQLAVQNAFARDWLRTYYTDILAHAVQGVFGARRRIDITVDPELSVPQIHDPAAPTAGRRESRSGVSPGTPTAHSSLGDSTPAAPIGSPSVVDGRAGSPSPGGVGPDLRGPRARLTPSGGLLWNSDVVLNPQHTFESFVVGPCNRFGHAAAMGAAEAPGRNYNPFFLHGRVGVGKTHLLQAICFLILERTPESRILYLSCETFVNHFVSALGEGDLTEFRHKYRNVDVLVVDDIHLLANKERTQEEFFHTFNTLYNAGKQIVLSSDSPPRDIPTLQERLVSRFKWGMVTEIEPPCYETRMAIVKRKAKDRGHDIPDEVARHIAERIDQNVRELEGAMTRLVGYSSMTGKPITLDLAREALGELFLQRRGAPTIDDVIAAVTEYFPVRLSDLQSKKRTKSITFPRQVAMYLARRITKLSLEEIGGYFGGRDHSTVLYGIDRIQTQVEQDEVTRRKVDELLAILQGGST